MVKKLKQQIRRSASQNNDENNTNEDPIDDTPDDETNLDEIVNKLKFIVPSEASLDIIKEDWIRTFATRNLIRKMDVLDNRTSEMVQKFPLFGSFDGFLIDLDFEIMFPAVNSSVAWEHLKCQILTKYSDLHSSIPSEICRALIIIKEKNPSRGAKRSHQGTLKISNLLEKIVEWMYPEDDIEAYVNTHSATALPILIVKGQQYSEGDTYIRVGKRYFSSGSDITKAFLR
ncbi:uncharacterized protein LOC134209127 [Armigeres subalbatus]|uniref:uncharacterized protein LOC134209127 n=1 Tax=Armigeres subalbatus TaxID=124917 RepID=UPI002ED364FB